MRHKLKTAAIFLMATLSSCSQEELLPSASPPSNQHSERVDYSITPEDALDNLLNFMDENPGSRATDVRTVATLTPISLAKISSRSLVADLDCENLVYIANFEQSKGYAILAADERIADKVIAIADSGSLSAATVYSAMERDQAQRPIFKGYPTTGPGFFTLPEYGDELFMNPNTASLYIKEKDDYLVGNLLDADLDTITSNGTSIELITSSMCISYAMRSIREREGRPQYYFETHDGSGNGGYIPPSNVQTKTSAWTNKKATPNFLRRYSFWTQKAPFNDWYPERRKNSVGKKRRASAGCVPLSIAKILTHFEYPKSYSFRGYTVNWTGLQATHIEAIDRLSAAVLLRSISVGCDSWCFYSGTFTFPHEAVNFMRRIGLNANNYRYDFNRVTSMLDAGKPLMIYSIPGIDITESHCWNIDGYKIKERTITTTHYGNNGIAYKTTTQKETCNMVHCDFGEVSSNGYYVSGVFKLNDPNSEKDIYGSPGKDIYYNNYVHIITY